MLKFLLLIVILESSHCKELKCMQKRLKNGDNPTVEKWGQGEAQDCKTYLGDDSAEYCFWVYSEDTGEIATGCSSKEAGYCDYYGLGTHVEKEDSPVCVSQYDSKTKDDKGETIFKAVEGGKRVCCCKTEGCVILVAGKKDVKDADQFTNLKNYAMDEKNLRNPEGSGSGGGGKTPGGSVETATKGGSPKRMEGGAFLMILWYGAVKKLL